MTRHAAVEVVENAAVNAQAAFTQIQPLPALPVSPHPPSSRFSVPLCQSGSTLVPGSSLCPSLAQNAVKTVWSNILSGPAIGFTIRCENVFGNCFWQRKCVVRFLRSNLELSYVSLALHQSVKQYINQAQTGSQIIVEISHSHRSVGRSTI